MKARVLVNKYSPRQARATNPQSEYERRAIYCAVGVGWLLVISSVSPQIPHFFV
jgi:hypothetical protein